jgi:AcrR family transcriptional regulator
MKQDRRVTRTRRSLVEAFNSLVLDRARGSKPIRVGDIVSRAKVGRSTFYDHYPSAEALHMEALARPFGTLADAAAGQGDEARLTHLLIHLWDNRARARRTLGGRTGGHAERLLASMVEERLDGSPLTFPSRLAAVQLAQSALAPVKSWLMGEAPCDPAHLALAICRMGRASLASYSSI